MGVIDGIRRIKTVATTCTSGTSEEGGHILSIDKTSITINMGCTQCRGGYTHNNQKGRLMVIGGLFIYLERGE